MERDPVMDLGLRAAFGALSLTLALVALQRGQVWLAGGVTLGLVSTLRGENWFVGLVHLLAALVLPYAACASLVGWIHGAGEAIAPLCALAMATTVHWGSGRLIDSMPA